MTTKAASAFDVDALRTLYKALDCEVNGKKLVYLDSACTALKPAGVAARLADFYANWGGCGGKRSTHLLSQQVEEWFYSARRAVSSFLRAETPNDIVFTSGTTEAANLLCRAFPYDDGRRKVVITDLEHNAVALPFLEAARCGELELVICPTDEGRIDLDRLASLLDEKTALLAMTHASNVMGGITPAAEAAKLARRKGAKVFIDDAQYLGTHREDVSTLGADFIAFSGHKLGGPFGIGVLWGQETELNRLRPFKVGGGTLKSLSWDLKSVPVPAYLDAPGRFEAGVQNFGGAFGLQEALKVRESLPAVGLRAHVGGLVRRLADGLGRLPEVRVLGRPADLERGSLVTFVPAHPGFSVVDFNLFLNHELAGRFVAIRVGEHCAHLQHRRLGVDATVRASLGPYNTAAEVDLFLDAARAYAQEACGG